MYGKKAISNFIIFILLCIGRMRMKNTQHNTITILMFILSNIRCNDGKLNLLKGINVIGTSKPICIFYNTRQYEPTEVQY